MEMSATEMIGLVAGVLSTGSFVPQVVKTLKTKDVSGISLFMYIAFCSGVFLWLVYGIINQQISIIAANGITLILSLMVLYLKIRYRNQRP